jgi:hypothetical protein
VLLESAGVFLEVSSTTVNGTKAKVVGKRL